MSGPKAKDGAPTGPPRGADDDPHERDTAPPNAPRFDAGPTSYRHVTPPPRTHGRAPARPPLGGTGLLGDPHAMRRVARCLLTGERFRNAMLDHQEGFIVSLLDPQLDVESLVDVSGMPTDDVLEILEGLRISGVIALD